MRIIGNNLGRTACRRQQYILFLRLVQLVNYSGDNGRFTRTGITLQYKKLVLVVGSNKLRYLLQTDILLTRGPERKFLQQYPIKLAGVHQKVTIVIEAQRYVMINQKRM